MLELSHNAQLMLAKSYEDAGDYEKAIEVCDNVANRYPEDKRAAQGLVNKAKIQGELLCDENCRHTNLPIHHQAIWQCRRYGRIS